MIKLTIPVAQPNKTFDTHIYLQVERKIAIQKCKNKQKNDSSGYSMVTLRIFKYSLVGFEISQFIFVFVLAF